MSKTLELTLSINSIKVLLLGTTDTIYFETSLPTPYPEMKYPPCVKMEAACGYGIEYVRKAFGREPDEIIDVRQSEDKGKVWRTLGLPVE